MGLLQKAQNAFAGSRCLFYTAYPVSGLSGSTSESFLCHHGAVRSRLDSVDLLGRGAIRFVALQELWEVLSRAVSVSSATLRSLWVTSLTHPVRHNPTTFRGVSFTVESHLWQIYGLEENHLHFCDDDPGLLYRSLAGIQANAGIAKEN